uniref:Solute carrier family 2, facilitated glucose transporter member 10 n=1 Tax=Latimeria chalumnae TaxID=7897 RepID=H3AK82_LATCH
GHALRTLLLSSTVSLLGGLLFGYELGIISGALLQLQIDFLLSCFQQEVLVSALIAGALFASLVGGLIIDYYGRRSSILLSNVIMFGGSFIQTLASSFICLVIGRITVGFAVSMSSMACCIYVSEMVGSHKRGMLVSLYEVGITVGILVAYALNYIFADIAQGWRYMFGLATIPVVLQFLSILFLPSNPTKPKVSESDDSSEVGLIHLQPLGETEDETSFLNDEKLYSFLDLFRARDNMKTRTLVGLGLVLSQQLTGQPNVLYYASTIFRSVGFQSNSSAVLASVGLGIVKVVCTLFAMGCADKAGRRVLLICGCIIMSASVTAIGLLTQSILLEAQRTCTDVAQTKFWNSSYPMRSVPSQLNITSPNLSANLNQSNYFANVTKVPVKISLNKLNKSFIVTPPYVMEIKNTQSEMAIQQSTEPVVLKLITLICMMAFVGAFSIGFGPMTWLILSEIYPAGIRGRAFAFSNSFNWTANLVVTLTFLDVIDTVGLSWTFLFYALMGMAAVGFIYFFLPETKGQSLEEINQQFSKKRSV